MSNGVGFSLSPGRSNVSIGTMIGGSASALPDLANLASISERRVSKKSMEGRVNRVLLGLKASSIALELLRWSISSLKMYCLSEAVSRFLDSSALSISRLTCLMGVGARVGSVGAVVAVWPCWVAVESVENVLPSNGAFDSCSGEISCA